MSIWTELAKPFPPERVEWRVGSLTADKRRGMALAYIDARTVMDRLDEAVGPGNWECTYKDVAGKTCCAIGIHAEADDITLWVTKEDGAGDTEFEAAKGAFSDSFKRAAVKWGVFRYGYGLPTVWVDVVSRGQSYAIADHEMPRLRALLTAKDINQPVATNSDIYKQGAFVATVVPQLSASFEQSSDTPPGQQPSFHAYSEQAFKIHSPGAQEVGVGIGVEDFIIRLANFVKLDQGYYSANAGTLTIIEEKYGSITTSRGSPVKEWLSRLREMSLELPEE